MEQHKHAYRVALVHDWLTGMRGGEKVLEVLCKMFPDAPLFTLVHNVGSMSSTIEKMDIHTLFIDKLPFKTKRYRHYLPIMPLAMEFMDTSQYDIILSTSHAVAKNARAKEEGLHICYCHTPMRYLWDLYDHYFSRGRAGILTRFGMRAIRPVLRWWDVQTNHRVHYFIANSHFVAERIRRLYNREADVIHPPVDTSKFTLSTSDDGYYLLVTALVPYKRVDLAIEAFKKCGEKLVIVGTGPDEGRLKESASKNIEFIGWVNDEELVKWYARCRALIFPGIEDFGIVPLEAMASGKPVIAYGVGGVRESVIVNEGMETGVFFYEQSVDALLDALKVFSKKQFDPYFLRRHAEKYDVKVFEQKLSEYIERRIREWEQSKNR